MDATCSAQLTPLVFAHQVPRETFEFLVRAFSGRVGWEGEASPFPVDDPSITHVIMDRPEAVRVCGVCGGGGGKGGRVAGLVASGAFRHSCVR